MTAEQITDIIANHLEERGLKFDRIDSNRIKMTYGGGDFNFDTLRCFLTVDEDGETMHFTASQIVRNVREEKVAEIMMACNEANTKFRWVKFFIDSDRDIMADCDAYVDENTAGKIAAGMVNRLANIVDDNYPTFMRILWA